jgi:hypothetical protein
MMYVILLRVYNEGKQKKTSTGPLDEALRRAERNLIRETTEDKQVGGCSPRHSQENRLWAAVAGKEKHY